MHKKKGGAGENRVYIQIKHVFDEARVGHSSAVTSYFFFPVCFSWALELEFNSFFFPRGLFSVLMGDDRRCRGEMILRHRDLTDALIKSFSVALYYTHAHKYGGARAFNPFGYIPNYYLVNIYFRLFVYL